MVKYIDLSCAFFIAKFTPQMLLSGIFNNTLPYKIFFLKFLNQQNSFQKKKKKFVTDVRTNNIKERRPR